MNIIRKNSPIILIVSGCVGIVMTGISVYKQTPKYLAYVEENPESGRSERFKRALRTFLPCILTGAGSAACFIGAHRIDVKRQAALASTLAATQGAYLNYKEKVAETLGEKAAEEVQEKIAEEKVKQNPAPAQAETYDYRIGEVLFLESETGQHFYATVEQVHQAEKRCFKDCGSNMFVSINEWFDAIDSPQLIHPRDGNDKGWNAEHPIDVTIKHFEERPGVITYVIDYLIPPDSKYSNLHGPIW